MAAVAVDYDVGRLDIFSSRIETAVRNGIPVSGYQERPSDSMFWHREFVKPAIPTRIIWLGFAVNTVVNSFFLCGVYCIGFAGWRLFRRGQGRKYLGRGLCPNCKYELDSKLHCSECGWSDTAFESA